MPPSETTCSLACTYVGVGPDGTMSMLASVVMVGLDGEVLLHDYIMHSERVTNWRTAQTGLSPNMWASENPLPLTMVQDRVKGMLTGRLVAGHSLWTDLHALGITLPALMTRDVALYVPFRTAMRVSSRTPQLSAMVYKFMSRLVETKEDNAAEKARGIMDLYRTVSLAWEEQVSSGRWPCILPPSAFARCFN